MPSSHSIRSYQNRNFKLERLLQTTTIPTLTGPKRCKLCHRGLHHLCRTLCGCEHHVYFARWPRAKQFLETSVIPRKSNKIKQHWPPLRSTKLCWLCDKASWFLVRSLNSKDLPYPVCSLHHIHSSLEDVTMPGWEAIIITCRIATKSTPFGTPVKLQATLDSQARRKNI